MLIIEGDELVKYIWVEGETDVVVPEGITKIRSGAFIFCKA